MPLPHNCCSSCKLLNYGDLNCGTASSFLNALVKALDRLHMVRAENSWYSGSTAEGNSPTYSPTGRNWTEERCVRLWENGAP